MRKPPPQERRLTVGFPLKQLQNISLEDLNPRKGSRPSPELFLKKSRSQVYLLGGYNRPNYDAQDKVLVFDPAQSGTSAWSDGQALTQGRGDAASAVAGDVAFALGGFHHSNWSYPMDPQLQPAG